MQKIIVLTVALAGVAAGAFYVVSRASNRPVVVGNQVQADDSSVARHVPLDQVDHSTWDRLLKKYVDDEGMVNYQAWKNSSDDLAALKEYLATLSHADADSRTSKEGKLAFWINAYNALTVHGILDVYPTSSIRNHTAKVLGYNIWKDLQLYVGGQPYSLEQIEHEILRKLGEPRIHFTIVCASIGCPRLRNEAYTPAELDAQLADNTRDFFSRQRNLQVDTEGRVVRVSSILDWFSEDFGAKPKEGLAGLAEYMPDRAARFVQQGDFSVDYLDYNWNLNKQ